MDDVVARPPRRRQCHQLVGRIGIDQKLYRDRRRNRRRHPVERRQRGFADQLAAVRYHCLTNRIEAGRIDGFGGR
jgi:hypothetical protein